MTSLSRPRALAAASFLLLLTVVPFSAYKGDLARASTTRTNIIMNPSFENGLDANGVPVNWNFSTCEGVANATVSLDSTVSVDGNHSARVYTGPVTDTFCLPQSGNRFLGFSQIRQFLPNPVNFTDLTDSQDGFSFWFKLQPYDNQSGMAGFDIRVFGAESTAELDYAFNPDPSLSFVNNTSVGSFLFYGYQPGQWYHFNRNLRADWLRLGLPLKYPFSLVQFEGLASQSGTTVKSETFWLDAVRAYVGATSPNPYLPGVNLGDTWRYGDFVELCEPPCSLGSEPNLNNSIATSTVNGISGSNVTVSLSFLSRGNTTSNVSTWDLATGVGRAATITGPRLLIAAGLGQGDHIFNTPSSATINETILGVYAGATRQIDVLNFTRSLGSVVFQRATYYDKTTGVLLEDRFAYQGFFISYKLTETNLWAYHITIPDDSSCNPNDLAPCGFIPLDAAVIVGTMVEWDNTGLLAHSVSSCTCAITSAACPFVNDPSLPTFSSGTIQPGLNYTLAFHTIGIYHYYDPLHLGMKATIAVQGNQTAPPNFSISSNPPSLTLRAGNSNFTEVSLAPLNGFSGIVTLSTSFPSGPDFPTVTGPQGGSVNLGVVTGFSTTLLVNTKTTTASGVYTATVTGTGGDVSNSVNIPITITGGVPGFTISANPTLLSIPSLPNRTGTLLPGSVITLTSFNNFTGPVALVATVFPQGVVNPELGGFLGNTMILTLEPNGTNQTILTPSIPPDPTPGTYFVTVTGTSGSISHSANVTVIVQPPVCGPPQCGIEALTLENDTFTSATDVTIFLQNTGTTDITFLAYEVKDAQGDQYSNTAWTPPSIPANTRGLVVVAIGSGCANCTLTGSPFTFSPGNAYAITVVTSRNNQFTFTVVSGAFTGGFSISANPDLIRFQQPGDPFPKTSAITLSSLDGFSGNIMLTARIVPIVLNIGGNGTVVVFPPFQVSVIPSMVGLTSGSVANATLLVSNAGAAPGSYEVNVTGTSGGVSHSLIVRLEVIPPPTDFNLLLSLSTSSTSIFAGQSSTIGVTLISTPFGAFFNGTVTLTAQISPSVPNGPNPSFNPAQISLIPPGQSFSTLTTSTTTSTPPGNYTITITGTSGTLVHIVQVPLRVLAPPTLTVSPSSGTLGSLVTVHGSGFPGAQPPFGFPAQVEITFDDQFIGFVFLTNSSFDFTFNIPHADPTKLHHIHAVDQFPLSIDVQTDFTFLPEPSAPTALSISVSTGPIYFPTDTVVIYVNTVQNGSPVASTVQLQLIRPNGTSVTLNAASVSTGTYKATYTLPRTSSTGTYAIVASASLNGENATALGSFEVKPPWPPSQSPRTTVTGLALVGIVGLLAFASWRGPGGILRTRRKVEV
ncbi:hypothetical protein AUG19_07415 [archaeon 13_1_20CM_2_54_9]|nr:MAG: hypothetical protein AUG19_07415 [archaeon 13_1_20CM_2_54_9]